MGFWYFIRTKTISDRVSEENKKRNHILSGSSMHFVSTIFTTIGYGGVTPVTFGANHIFAVNILVIKIMDTSIICVSGGKFMTILMIVTLIPFFLHCLCTSASNINILIDRFKLHVYSFGDVNTLCQTASTYIIKGHRCICIFLGFALALISHCIGYVNCSGLHSYCIALHRIVFSILS